jgi:hypothetical protein
MKTFIVFITAFVLFFCSTFGEEGSLIVEMENYNGWNLPFAKTVYIEVKDDSLSSEVLPSWYALECSMNAYFGVFFSPRPLPEDLSDPPLQIELAFYGFESEVVTGYFTDIDLTFEGI